MKILNKNILREFKFSIARFISITTLLALGVFILIGLKVTGTDMRSAGRLPNKSNEIALNNKDSQNYHIGDHITLKDKDNKKISKLKNSKYKIVGFITSADYLLKQNLATTSVGTGQIDTYAVVSKSAFKSLSPTTALIKYNNLKGSSYTDSYERQVEKNVSNSEPTIRKIVNERKQEIIDQAYTSIDNKKEIIQKKYGNNADVIINKEKEKVKFETDNLNYQIQSRNDYNQGYNQYGEDAKRIDILSNTFPIIFFAVAILVVLITMSRMGEEKRIELGTLVALGYKKSDAMKVFILYGLLSSIIGTSIGAWFGTTLLPKKIFNAYAANFVIPNFQTKVSWIWIGISFLITTTCTVLPALYVAGKSLREKPAKLMLPKPPKKGSKILLERIRFVWKKLSFNHKVTMRNLFRYKFKSFMTIIGILGCTALLITGFGIKDSLNGIVKTQYNDIIHYDLIGMYNTSYTTKNINNYKNKISDIHGIKNKTTIYYENITSKASDMNNNQQISLVVPKSEKEFDKYVTLKSPRDSEKISLSNNGVVITEKLAQIMHVTTGDQMTIKTSNGKKYKVKVSHITQMFAGHDIYMSSNYYRKVFNKFTNYNAIMMKLSNRSSSNIDNISRQLTKQHSSLTVVQSDDAKETINNILGGLNNLVLIIIIAASLLAFVVLFTLTNINVSERIRELSTIKVLGFYPMEVVMYIYRETLMLTMIGIILGFVGGSWLHNYIMQTLPPETAMADMTLFLSNFAISGLMTILFSIIVMAFMAYKIKKVDMLGALKSVD
ncbi:ABC transporter permease [Companilactobacillus insicii]|uniref:ABC transporter permease n=1 Tax=Companilactobacillus insicii TaxID=1732567 RepID=UPI000F7BAE16|nr:ABC transporter permease [Companilactobacillus insicii]